MKLRLLALLLLLCCSSCQWIAWIGYSKPQQSDYEQVEGAPIKIGTQNLDTEERKAILEATADVFKIFKSSTFKERVTQQTWLISCEIDENEKKDTMPGSEVYSILTDQFINYSINPRKPWNAIGQTQKSPDDHTKNRVAIKPKRIDGWYNDSNEIKANLINTIAHETVHTVSFRFKDRGHGTDECPDAELVSYGIGNLVEEIWLAKR